MEYIRCSGHQIFFSILVIYKGAVWRLSFTQGVQPSNKGLQFPSLPYDLPRARFSRNRSIRLEHYSNNHPSAPGSCGKAKPVEYGE